MRDRVCCLPSSVALSLVLVSGACTPKVVDRPSDAMVVGAVLPFTGASAKGPSLERALLMAVEQVNAAGGIGGRPLYLQTVDSRSSAVYAEEAARQLLALQPVAMIGPEEDAANQVVASLCEASQVVFLAPSAELSPPTEEVWDGLWFRTATPSVVLAEALAKRMARDEAWSVIVVAASDAYSQSFAEKAASRFVELGGSVSLSLVLSDDGKLSLLDVDVVAALEPRPQAIMLVAGPSDAAAVVNTFAVAGVGEEVAWYFAPSLYTDMFSQNLVTGSVRKGVGVAAATHDTDGSFGRAFARRWAGEAPTAAVVFYYDSMALLSLALEATSLAIASDASVALDGTGYASLLGSSISSLSIATGIATTWANMEVGLARLREGQQVYYYGVSGLMKITARGEREAASSEYWLIDRNRVVAEPAL